jgi:hypothetical protein
MPYVPSPLLLGDFLHVVSDEGIYTCFDPWSGNVHVRKRLSKHVSSSIVAGADRIYVSDDLGTTYVLRNGGAGEVLAKNSIGEELYSTPAIAHQCLFVRGVKHLFCIGSPQSVAMP